MCVLQLEKKRVLFAFYAFASMKRALAAFFASCVPKTPCPVLTPKIHIVLDINLGLRLVVRLGPKILIGLSEYAKNAFAPPPRRNKKNLNKNVCPFFHVK